MSINIRYPNITGTSDKEQITQIKSYLHQLVEQLNYVLNTLGAGDAETTNESQSGSQSNIELEAFLAEKFAWINYRLNQLSDIQAPEVGVDYFTEEDKAQIVQEVLAALKEE